MPRRHESMKMRAHSKKKKINQTAIVFVLLALIKRTILKIFVAPIIEMEVLTFVKRKFICSRYLTESFHELRNFIVSRSSAGRDLEEVCEDWNPINSKSTFPFHIRSIAKNDSTSFEFCPTPSKRGFENKKPNCWTNVVMLILYATPLKILGESSKLDIAVVLDNLFENMSKVTKTPITIVDLKKVTNICNIPMAIKNHQDVNDLLNVMLNNLVEDPFCGSSIRPLFQCCSISIKSCVVYSNI